MEREKKKEMNTTHSRRYRHRRPLTTVSQNATAKWKKGGKYGSEIAAAAVIGTKAEEKKIRHHNNGNVISNMFVCAL